MRLLRIILPILIAAFLLGGCRSQKVARKEKAQQEDNARLIHTLLETPPVSELTASLSLNLNGTKVSGQLRMRRGRSVQISASMLGLVEVARIEFLPEMVVVMDRSHNLSAVCHYADIPYRNEWGLDFDMVQSLLWNRIFSPGSSDEHDAASRLQVEKESQDGVVNISDMEYGYLFSTDGKNRLDRVSKTGSDYSFAVDYSDFTAVSGKWLYPLGLLVEINTSSVNVRATAKMSSVQTEKKNWADRTQVTRRMKQVTLDELLDNLDL